MPRLLTLCALAALLLPACDATRDTPSTGAAGDREPISSAFLTIGGTRVSIVGLGDPVISDSLRLVAGAAYTGSVELDGALDGLIRSEAESHLFAYEFGGAPSATVTLTDAESQYASQNLNDGDYPLGRTFRIEVDSAATGVGSMTLRLRHFEGVAKSVTDGSVGDDDFSVVLPVRYTPLPSE